MSKNKLLKMIVVAIISCFILQMGFLVYSISTPSSLKTEQPAESTGTVTIPEEILTLIEESDPANYDKNIENYKELLVNFNVHEKFQTGIEDLVNKGYQLPDILIAYRFLNDQYGKLADVENLVKAKAAGNSWVMVFTAYNAINPAFVPGSFDSDYLEGLLNTPGITKDDIMIADRVSQKTSVPFKSLIQKRIEGMDWKDINAELDIVNGQAELLHVPADREKLDQYMQSTGLPEMKVMEAFVLAFKTNADIEAILDKLKSGLSKEHVFADCLESKYY